jgi:hypothetical protein
LQVLLVVVIEREFLLAMSLVIGVIEVEHNGGGRLGVAGDEVVDQRVGEEVCAFLCKSRLDSIITKQDP